MKKKKKIWKNIIYIIIYIIIFFLQKIKNMNPHKFIITQKGLNLISETVSQVNQDNDMSILKKEQRRTQEETLNQILLTDKKQP